MTLASPVDVTFSDRVGLYGGSANQLSIPFEHDYTASLFYSTDVVVDNAFTVSQRMTIDNMRWHRSFRKHVVFCQTPGQSLVSMILMTDFYEYYSYIFSSCCYPRHFRYVCLLLIDVTQFVLSCLTSERFFHVVHSIQLLSALFRQTFTVNGLKRRDIYMPLLFYFCYTQCSLTKMKSKRCCLLCRLLGAAVAAL